MDIKTEKLQIIARLAKIEDKKIINKIKAILNATDDVVVGYHPSGEVIDRKELITRAKASNKAIKEGRLTTLEDLKKESDSW